MWTVIKVHDDGRYVNVLLCHLALLQAPTGKQILAILNSLLWNGTYKNVLAHKKTNKIINMSENPCFKQDKIQLTMLCCYDCIVKLIKCGWLGWDFWRLKLWIVMFWWWHVSSTFTLIRATKIISVIIFEILKNVELNIENNLQSKS